MQARNKKATMDDKKHMAAEYAGKIIMILGAGVYQVPLIAKARSLGMKTVVLSREGKYPGIPMADIFLPIDITDSAAVLQAAKGQNIDGIATTGSDVGMLALGLVNESLGLSGVGSRAGTIASNKALMKELFVAHGVATAAFTAIVSKEELSVAADLLGYPFMLKAADASGCRGVIRVDKKSELNNAWTIAHGASRCGSVVAESFLSGVEIGATLVLAGKEVQHVFLHRRVGPEGQAALGRTLPIQVSSILKEKIIAMLSRAAAALDIQNTFADADIMLVGEEPYLIEMAGRMGGTCLPELIQEYTGIDVYEGIVRFALGMPVAFLPRFNGAVSSLLIQAHTNGELVGINIPKHVVEHQDVVRILVESLPGEMVSLFRHGSDRLGDVVVRAKNPAEAENFAAKVVDSIEITIQ